MLIYKLLRKAFHAAIGFCFLVQVCLITGPSAVFAQSATATLSGTVVDERGGVIPEANITVTDPATNQQRRTTTNSEGTFTISQLPPSAYIVIAQRTNFSVTQLSDIVLYVGDQRSLRIILRAGAITNTINVTGDTSLIDEAQSVSTVIDRQFVENLPLSGRSFQSLIQLTPGVVPTANTANRLGQFSVNGQRESANYFMIDGVSANLGVNTGVSISGSGLGGGAGQYPAYSAVGGTNSLVSVDALQEFRIQTSTFAPEFGRTPGGQVSIVTRSGGNDFHGSLFEYFRNEKLDANDFFANRAGVKRAALRNNQFGGAFSGPLYLPRFGEGGKAYYDGHNRTFFFFSYEGLRLRLPQFRTEQVPSLDARGRASGAVRALFDAFPVPNGRDLGGGLAEFNASYSDPSSLDATSLRIDHKFSERLTLFGRYNYSPSESAVRGFSASYITPTRYTIDTLTAGATLIASPRAANDLRINFSRNRGDSRNVSTNFGGAVPPTDAAVFPSFASREDGYARLGVLGGGPNLEIGKIGANSQRQFNVVDTFSIATGAHQIKFGGDYRRLSPTLNVPSYRLFGFFSSVEQAITGRSAVAVIQAFRGPVEPRFNNISFFLQDTWKVTPRLTLTYGLRYEVNPPPSEANGQNLNAIIVDNNDPSTARPAPPDAPIYKTTYNNFAPRVGVAYHLLQSSRGATVLRGGVGVFYDISPGQVSNAYAGAQFPFGRTRTVAGTAQNPLLYPFPAAVVAIPEFDPNRPNRTFATHFDPNLKLPYTLQWNLTIEQSLGAAQTVTASYVGSTGRRLYRTNVILSPNADFGELREVRNDAESNYHALQLQFQRRLARGLQALGSYSYSHSIDTASVDLPFGFTVPQSSVEQNRGPSDFDIRHAFTSAITYNIPVPGAGPIGNAFFRNFAVDVIYKAYSAPPVDVFNNTPTFYEVRPDLIAGVPLYIHDSALPGGRRINPAALAKVTSNRQGTLGRNSLRGFGASQLDLAVRRQFDLTERARLQFKAEFFNLPNHPNFASPVANLDDTTNFGRATRMLNRGLTGFNSVYQIGGPRSIQLSMKLNF